MKFLIGILFVFIALQTFSQEVAIKGSFTLVLVDDTSSNKYAILHFKKDSANYKVYIDKKRSCINSGNELKLFQSYSLILKEFTSSADSLPTINGGQPITMIIIGGDLAYESDDLCLNNGKIVLIPPR
jgi:hypothetical protein